MIITITPNPLLDFVLHSRNIPDPGGRRLDNIEFTVGGKGINVARMLKTLGRPALALSFAGGPNGQKIREGLQQQGISAELIETEAETRLGINLVVENPTYHTWWIENGQELKKSEINLCLRRLEELLPQASVVAMSGTVPGAHNDDFYREVLRLCLQYRVEIYLDARGKPLLNACELGGFFLKHNRDEAIETFALDPFKQTSEFIEQLQNKRIWGALITDGRNEALLWDGQKALRFFPLEAREVSAVGCGDATLAGLIFGRRQGLDLVEAVNWGLACGAADVERPGPCEADFAAVSQKFKQLQSLRK